MSKGNVEFIEEMVLAPEFDKLKTAIADNKESSVSWHDIDGKEHYNGKLAGEFRTLLIKTVKENIVAGTITPQEATELTNKWGKKTTKMFFLKAPIA